MSLQERQVLSNASNARDVTAGRMGRNSSVLNVVTFSSMKLLNLEVMRH